MRRTTSAFILIMVVALLVSVPGASLADRPANYLAIKAGVYSPSNSFDLENFNGGTFSHLDTKTRFDGEIAIGHYFLPILAIEISGGYFENKGTTAVPQGEAFLRVVPVLATGKLLLPLGPVEPYGEFGIGAYFTKAEVQGNIYNFNTSTQITYGLHAGGGLNIDLTDNFFIGVEGRYLWARPSFGGQDIRLDGFTATGDLGFRF